MKVESEGGFTVLEAAVSMAVLAVALLTLWGTIAFASSSNLAAEQRQRALQAARAKIEQLKASPFDTLIEEYGPGGPTGDLFAVPTIDADAATAQGQVLFYVDETQPPESEGLGLYLDLNGDGDAADVDVSAEYQLLPVKVFVRWNGILGEQRLDLCTILRKEE